MTAAVVFIDYQNAYKRARGAFGWEDSPGQYGNLQPLELGRFLVGQTLELTAVHVYTGVPSQNHNKKGYDIMQRRIAAWKSADPEIVSVHPRTLRYPPRQGHEKGVDVELAVDLVALAIDKAYQVGVVVSVDSDLVPAIEVVKDRFPGTIIETVGWDPEPGCGAPPPLDIPSGDVIRRFVNKADFNRVADRANYVNPRQSPRRRRH